MKEGDGNGDWFPSGPRGFDNINIEFLDSRGVC